MMSELNRYDAGIVCLVECLRRNSADRGLFPFTQSLGVRVAGRGHRLSE